ncbi:RagB/SusD family nutrient uptake outer membrane protein [Parabacteroides sp. AM58-2XD]|uniref:RagB/SusD family nutrient uptake outer membrane protein n=1 Tax=Parabacteroides sp. AM58-2XD TaxID=2292362 RepID=UPI001F428E38|nr:RagB/SusD family nutrient uptake outer membrane protein [Parabacteroides sp. AM58-2XD]
MKLNKIKQLSIGLVTILLVNGCNSLDISNLWNYDADLVWNDDNLATAYVTDLYGDIFSGWSTSADNTAEQQTGIPFMLSTITTSGSGYKRWNYTNIRNINLGLEYLAEGGCTESVKNSLTGQMLFMRAYQYGEMLVYHGGMPYITKAQDKDEDDLYVTRTSTAECFDLIIKDLDDAITLLPAKATGNDYGRIDQCFAKAYKAKMLLYKASPQFNPSNMYDNKYWNEAYTAAKEAYDFCIAQGIKLTANYADNWLVDGNSEVVFPIIYSNPDKTADWENTIRPSSLSRSNANNTPTWDMVKAFPMLDGKRFDDPAGKYYAGAESEFLQKFWQNRDPRFEDCILYNADLYPVSGTASGYRQYTSVGIAVREDSYGINPNVGSTATQNDAISGMYVRKGSDLSLSQDLVSTYDHDYPFMRLAEVMFIYAEAANETDHQDVAVDMLKQIRKRAGIEAGENGLYGLKVANRKEIRQAILDERNVELCFEGHRFMDLRRTRNMMQLNGLQKYGVEAIAINEDGSEMDIAEATRKAKTYSLTPDNFKYILRMVPISALPRINF